MTQPQPRKALALLTDLDGVVCNLMGEALSALWTEFGCVLSPSACMLYDTAEAWLKQPQVQLAFSAANHGSSKKDLEVWLDHNVWTHRERLLHAQPYWEVLGAYHEFMRVQGAGTVIPCTSRSLMAHVIACTQSWCSKWGLITPPHFGKVTVVADVMRAMHADGRELIILEDHPPTVEGLLPVVLRTAGELGVAPRPIILIDRPWNQGFPASGVERVAEAKLRAYLSASHLDLT